MRPARRLAAVAVLVAAAVLAAACGSVSPGRGTTANALSPARLPLATAIGGAGQSSWAAVEMGGSAASHENFWDLFSRPAGAAQWQLATPPGVASNGGLNLAAQGAGLVTGFGPSQDLSFSPLAAIASPAGTWSAGSALVTPGLASDPDALATGPAGKMLALTRTGEVLAGRHDGSNWARLVTFSALARSAPGRACGLVTLTAIAFSAAGTPLVGGQCTRPGQVGIFADSPAGWQAVGPALPSALATRPVTVLGLLTSAGRTTVLAAGGSSSSTAVLAAWSASGAGRWTVSAAVRTGAGAPLSLSLWSGGAVALVLAHDAGETISGPGATWRSLPPLPAGTATLAPGQNGQPEALAVDGGTLAVWQLAHGSASWSRLQQIKVTIPYGSSG